MQYDTEIPLPAGLAKIAGTRDHIPTADFARAFSKRPATVRKNYCLTGEAFGIKPVKVGNSLLWSVAAIAAKLQGGVK